MRILESANRARHSIRWQMLILFAFFSVLSTFLVACFAVAVLNVVIRRESAYFVEERINGIVDISRDVTTAFANGVRGCDARAPDPPGIGEYASSVWPGSQRFLAVLPKGSASRNKPAWLDSDSFDGIIVDHGSVEIRSRHEVKRPGCSLEAVLRIPLTRSILEQLSTLAGVQISISESQPVLLRSYLAGAHLKRIIEANFIPWSKVAVSAVVTARNWQTGRFEDWAVCKVRPSYRRTTADLSHLGMQRASWVSLLGGIGLALVFVYACGLLLSVRLSRRIVSAVDGLSQAAAHVGKGDFSVRVSSSEQDQLGVFASSFNRMTQDLETLREQDKQRVVLERDMALAHQVQQYLYPRVAPKLRGASVYALTTPARVVSGDLYDVLRFSDDEIGLLCADISGKGVSAALMMAHLQALVHARLLISHESSVRPTPAAFATGLNRDLRGRFGNNRYTTMFYGELDTRGNVLRYVNAGHCPPILISEAGEPVKLSDGDVPVGLLPEITYKELRVSLLGGYALVVYTDGVTDALNSKEEQFGEERLISACASLPQGADAQAICEFLSSKVRAWTEGVPQFDDTTLLVVSVEQSRA
jgi:serine phosphatase RsbU (regulator of sigma subunit)